jgi:hypothetical protein
MEDEAPGLVYADVRRSKQNVRHYEARETTMPWTPASRNAMRWLCLWLLIDLGLAFTLLAYPLYVIWPFRYQGARELNVALAILRVRPVLEIALVAIAVAVAALAWRKSRGRLGKAGLAACVLLVAICAGLACVNVYELMFHPMEELRFAEASQASLGGEEQVLAVRINGTARAYPIRSLSYHHMVNDTLDGIPLIATY